jgi:hypothetical protein
MLVLMGTTDSVRSTIDSFTDVRVGFLSSPTTSREYVRILIVSTISGPVYTSAILPLDRQIQHEEKSILDDQRQNT